MKNNALPTIRISSTLFSVTNRNRQGGEVSLRDICSQRLAHSKELMKNITRPLSLWLMVGLLAATHANVAMSDDEISCENYDFSYLIRETGEFDNEHKKVLSIYDELDLFSSASSGSPTGRAPFGARFHVQSDPSNESRLEVRDFDGNGPYWVDRASVLCREYPVRDESQGIYRRAFTKVIKDEVNENPVVALPAPGYPQVNCDPVKCPKLQRFAMNYVWAVEEKNGVEYYLLANGFETPESIGFIGWVDSNRLFDWDTSIGFLPVPKDRDAANFPPDSRGIEDYDDTVNLVESQYFLCGYASPQDIGREEKCQKIFADDSWYANKYRPPLLGTGTTSNGREYVKIALSSTGLATAATREIDAEGFKHIDVMYVLDGTKSMTTAIAAIAGTNHTEGVVQRLNSELTQVMKSKGGSYRAGFQIFRDAIFDKSTGRILNADGGINEGFALNDQNCDSGWQSDSDPQAYSRFISEFSNVRAKDKSINGVTDRDFHENTFGGLSRAIANSKGCSNRLKIFILVGDHGYSTELQSSKGNRVFSIDELSQRLYGNDQTRALFDIPPQIFAIHMPNTRFESDAKQAHRDFRNQTLELAGKRCDTFKRRAAQSTEDEAIRRYQNEYKKCKRNSTGVVAKISNSDSIESIVDKVSSLVNERVVDTQEVIDRIVNEIESGGNNVYDLVDSEEFRDRFNMPAQMTQDMLEVICSQAGMNACSGEVEFVQELYVPYPDNSSDHPVELQEEIWLSDTEFRKWIRLLEMLVDVEGVDRREEYQEAIIEMFQSVLKIDPAVSNEAAFTDILTHSDLPAIKESPIMGYSMGDLLDRARVSTCEMEVLKDYMRDKLEALNVLKDGKHIPVTPRYPVSCGNLSPQGEKLIPRGVSEIVRVGPRDERGLDVEDYEQFKFIWPMGNNQNNVYWIPKLYLP